MSVIFRTPERPVEGDTSSAIRSSIICNSAPLSTLWCLGVNNMASRLWLIVHMATADSPVQGPKPAESCGKLPRLTMPPLVRSLYVFLCVCHCCLRFQRHLLPSTLRKTPAPAICSSPPQKLPGSTQPFREVRNPARFRHYKRISDGFSSPVFSFHVQVMVLVLQKS